MFYCIKYCMFWGTLFVASHTLKTKWYGDRRLAPTYLLLGLVAYGLWLALLLWLTIKCVMGVRCDCKVLEVVYSTVTEFAAVSEKQLTLPENIQHFRKFDKTLNTHSYPYCFKVNSLFMLKNHKAKCNARN